MLVALTGGTGFVGRHVAATLARRGHTVRVLARDPARARFLADQGVEVVTGQLADRAALARLARGVDAVIHLVGIIVEQGPQTFAAVHVEGTRAVLAAARATGVRRYVHMSAVGARDDPAGKVTRYHPTKWQAGKLVRDSRLPPAIFPPSIINGPQSAPLRLLGPLPRWAPLRPAFGGG